MELDQLSPRAQLLRMWLGGPPLLPVVSALGGPQGNNMEFHPPSKVQRPSFLLSSVSCFSFIHSAGLYHACLSWPIWPQNPSISWDDLVCSAWKTANIVNPINISWDENQEGGTNSWSSREGTLPSNCDAYEEEATILDLEGHLYEPHYGSQATPGQAHGNNT